MVWYLINILAFVIAWYWPISKESEPDSNRIRSKRTCITAAIGWILLSGLRGLSVGADTEAYAIMFEQSAYSPWSDIWQNVVLKYIYRIDVPGKDFGYFLLQKVFRTFTGSYTLWLLFIAIVFTVPMAILIYRYSSNACISWIVYSTLFYSFFAITGHRQTIATAIVVWGGLECIRKRKLIPFLLLTFIAYTIHASAICVLPFYWISQLKVTKAKLSIYMVGIVAAFLLRNQLLVFLQSIVGYEFYQQYEGARAGVFLFLLIAMAVFTFIFWEQIQNSDNQVLNMSVNALMMACVFSPLLLINPSCMRVVQYYSVFIIFLIPEFRFAFHDNSKALFLRIIAIIMILLLVKQMPSYSFFFM